MEPCTKCGRWVYGSGGHTCPPRWRVWDSDMSPGDGEVIYATDAEEAAEKWAEQDDNNSAEYRIAQGHDAIVSVHREGDPSVVERFKVSGEYVAQYSARSLEPASSS